MGYRERQAHRARQQQEGFSQKLTGEGRSLLPAPVGMNTRDDRNTLSPNQAVNIVNAVPDQDGLRVARARQARSYIASTSAGIPMHFIGYHGSGSSSAELWAIANRSNATLIYNIGEVIDGGTTATASGISAPTSSGARFGGSHVEFNKSVIFVNGGDSYRWDRANGWQDWSASVSAGSADHVDRMWWIGKFKKRLYAGEQDSATFYYGSVDQVIGNLNAFDLSTVLGSNIKLFSSLTRDGGSGPDDFAVFVGEDGKTAVYQGSNPGDASDWSLVGVYQIGRPISKNGYVQYGQQLIVFCEDDVYFLPDDLAGKRQSTPFAHRTTPAANNPDNLNAVLWDSLIVAGEGSVLSTNHNFAYTTVKTTSAEPYTLQRWKPQTAYYPVLAVYLNKLYCFDSQSGELATIYELMPKAGSDHQGAKITTAKLTPRGRANIGLVNPVFQIKNEYASTTANAATNIKYRTAITYDKSLAVDASLSANAWLTTSTSADSLGQWLPGFGTGNRVQLSIEVLSASSSADIVFSGIDFTFSDTGGL